MHKLPASWLLGFTLAWSGLAGFPVHAQPAEFQPLDLSAHFNVTNGPAGNAVFPQGAQTLRGVPFTLGGRIELTGLEAAGRGDFQPAQVTGIQVGAKAARLHLIHGALHGAKDGTPLANVVWHYEDGETRVARLAFGVQARNVVATDEESRAPLADGDSALAWPTTPPGPRQGGARLYHSVLLNPRPQAEVARLDYVSLFSKASPVLFAITLQRGAELPVMAGPLQRKVVQRATEFPDSAYRRTMQVRVNEAASGLPVTNATALVTVQDDARAFYFGAPGTDARGTMAVEYPPQAAVSLAVRVRAPGFVVASRTLLMHDAPWPESIEVKLERGQTVGGLVVDPKGQPVAGATVTPYEVTPLSSNEFTRADFEPARTGGDGRWQTPVDTRSLSNLALEISHPEYRPASWPQADPAQLAGRSLRTILQPERRVAGRIVTPSGRPVAQATVILDYGPSSHVVRYADDEGRFAFVVRDTSADSAQLLAFAKGLAPVLRPVKLDALQPVGDIVLKPGSTFRLKMVDGRGRPVPGVSVKLSDWEGSKAMSWANKTDSEGRFRWDHAPEGRLTFEYEKPGYSRYLHTLTLPMSDEINYTYAQPLRVAGRVVDGANGKPVDQFRVLVRYSYKNGSGSTSTYGRNGTFNSTIGTLAYETIELQFEARGYEPLSEKLPVPEGSYSNVFTMRRARMIPVVLTAPDGSPAAGTEVILLDRTKSGFMDEPGKFRRSATVYDIAVTDAEGRTELTPKLEADLVLAAHPQLGFAQAPLRQVTNSPRLALQPWGVIRGTLRVGDKVEPFHQVAVRTVFNRDPANEPRTAMPLSLNLDVKPEANGSFILDTIPPGTRSVSLRYKFTEKENYTPKLSHAVVVDVEPGRTNDIVIGGTGRTVTGRVNTKGLAAGQVDWRRDTHTLVRQQSSRIPPPLRYPPGASAQERAKLMAERTAMLEAMRKAQVRENLIERTYIVLFEDDGSFRIPNVPPGAYYLNLHPTDARQPNNYRTVGNASHEVIVPEGAAPLDIGQVELRLYQP